MGEEMSIAYAMPAVFAGLLLLFAAAMKYLGRYAARGSTSREALDAYACGHRGYENYVNPDYTQFFRYAFVFSVMHVLALSVATAPKGAALLPLAYIAGGVLTLVIIFRK